MLTVLNAASRHFIESWTRWVEPIPELIPEASWPWIHVMDAWLRPLRCRTDWTPKENELFFGATCVMAEFVLQCLERLGYDVRISKSGETFTLAVKTRGGFLSKWSTLPIHDAFRQMLQSPRTPMPILPKQLIAANDDTNLAVAFALGACLACSPYAKGDSTFQPEVLEKILPVFAESSAKFYGRIFPGEPLGCDAGLVRRLMWPPPEFSGSAGAAERARAMAGYLGLFPARFATKFGCVANLALMPVDSISSSALLTLAATPDTEFSAPLLERACRLFRPTGAGFRKAVWDVRRGWIGDEDYLRSVPRKPEEYLRERRLGLLAGVVMPAPMAFSDEYLEITTLLAGGELAPAAKALDKRAAGASADHHFQRAVIEKLQGNLVEADTYFAKAVEGYGGSLNPECVLEWGINALDQKDYDDALMRFKRAHEVAPQDGIIVCNYGWALANVGRPTEAIRFFDQAISDPRAKLDALVKRAFVRFQSGDTEGSHKDLLEAAKVHPYDPRVVANLLASAME